MAHACLFCDIEGFRADSVLFAENELALFGNREAGDALNGSGVIVPKAHKPTVFDLSPEEISATFALLRQVRPLLEHRYNPDGFNVGWIALAQLVRQSRMRTYTCWFVFMMSHGLAVASVGGSVSHRTAVRIPSLRAKVDVTSMCPK